MRKIAQRSSNRRRGRMKTLAALGLFLKRWYWKSKFHKCSKDELLAMIKRPNKDTADLLWMEYFWRVRDVRELMVIVYDDFREFPLASRMAAGEQVIALLGKSFYSNFGWRYLHDVDWFNPDEGRIAYLIGIDLSLPQLRDKIDFTVNHSILSSFTCPERQAFAEYTVQ